ncbi:MAG: amino acid adenylation domain-containing protein, partial [Cyanobacteria bacterium]|nr:amino acid adenylation domain-containing protein [Cyanobacteriota bacterium]
MMPPDDATHPENHPSHQNVLRRWIEGVHQHPHHIAVLENEDLSTSYQTLHQQALQVAQYLIHHCSGNFVGLCLEKSTPYLAALLGCWLAKKTFVPLAPQLPDIRRKFILEDAGIDFLITPTIYQKSIITPLQPNFENSLDLDIPVDFPAYIIYTSGSTGTPKGVMVSHNGLVNLADCQREGFQVDHTSRYLWYVSTQFDASLSDILVTFLSGATLIIETQNHTSKMSMATHLLDWVKRLRITHLDIPPALLKQLDPENKPPCLQTIVIGGEVCEKETVIRWAEKVNLVNVYGPTEATVCTSFCRCTSGWEVPLIGDPIAHTTYEIFDESLTPCAPGVPGELYIAGIGLALGYVNLEALTQEKFIVHQGIRYYKTGDQVVRLPEISAFPGKIQFLGRLDRQVKIRGQLVALEEVEEALKAHPKILQAYVTKQTESTHHREALVAFIQWRGNDPNPSSILKEYLNNTLPS